MMQYLLIDPKMYLRQGEEQVKKDIHFFREVIDLSNNGIITICLYKEILDKLNQNAFSSFPIDLNLAKTPELRDKIKILNCDFNSTIMRNYEYIDFDSCSGDQDFYISKEQLKKDNDYFTFFSMLIGSCYSKQKFSDNILIGQDTDDIKYDEDITVSCHCEETYYEHTYYWVLPNTFYTSKQTAMVNLKRIIDSQGDLFVESPTIKKGHHHNKIQKDSFDYFNELSSENKRVFSSLRQLGLSEISFGNFHQNNHREVGSISINNVSVSTNELTDIVEGWFYSELGFQISVRMHFPKEVGKNLYLYFGSELNQKNVEQFIIDLGI